MRERIRAASARGRIGQRINHATELAGRAWHLIDHTARRASELEGRVTHLERLASIEATMRWIEQATVPHDVLVSVLTVTRNRSDLLPEAIASLQAQAYPNWELILVDDGSNPEHAAAASAITAADSRIVAVAPAGRGLAAGRNTARRAASGSLITHLDDDNLMHPLWLKAVVWGFGQRPDVDIFCGARLIDDVERAAGLSTPGLPAVQFEEVDHTVLERRMQTDSGSIAHRASVETRSDERFARNDDWDWLARATRTHPYASLPCIAQTYRTNAVNRLSGSVTTIAESG